MPIYPSRSEMGTERMNSRLTATTMGRIMIAKRNPARKTLSAAGDSGSSERKGMKRPNDDAIHHSIVSRSRSERSPAAQSPKTTEGIAAMSSTMKVSGAARRGGANSTR